MNRSRSPQYPSLSLPQAIDMVAKLHKANRTSIITRETAAKDLGYAGLTGRSLTVIAALAQYGLIEKAGKGDIKVSRRAVDILHSVEDADRAEAIRDAALAPNLFQQLLERFPEGVPSQNALRSFLIQLEFGDVAIGPAINAFLETIAFAENAKESGRTGDTAGAGAGSRPDEPMPEPTMTPHTSPSPPTISPAMLDAVATALASSPLNKINMNIQGDHVSLSATLNYRGLAMLEKKIAGLKALMMPDDDDTATLPIEGDLDEKDPA
ncbi:MAG: hypothetical protein M3R41_03460 [Pseudomonadota bacterium]|nr:hypothetical protein [Pseudomonadota bacterium]